jgi:hypothetical protein
MTQALHIFSTSTESAETLLKLFYLFSSKEESHESPVAVS